MAQQDKEKQKQLLSEIMNEDGKDGLYEPVTNGHTLTAVEWLFNMLWKTPQYETEWQELYKQAKQMEKEQIIDAWKHGDGEFDEAANKLSEQYYKETYNSNK